MNTFEQGTCQVGYTKCDRLMMCSNVVRRRRKLLALVIPLLALQLGTLSKAATKNDRVIADVRTYGAICDGVANDSSAIQAAIDVAGLSGDGIVEFPVGSLCNVGTTSIKIKHTYHGLTLQSEGWASIQPGHGLGGVKYSGKGAAIIVNSDAAGKGFIYNFRLEGLAVALSDAGDAAIGIWLQNANHYRMDNVEITTDAHWTGKLNQIGLLFDGNSLGQMYGIVTEPIIGGDFLAGVKITGTIAACNTSSVFIGGSIGSWVSSPLHDRRNSGVLVNCGDSLTFQDIDVEQYGTAWNFLALSPSVYPYRNILLYPRSEMNTYGLVFSAYTQQMTTIGGEVDSLTDNGDNNTFINTYNGKNVVNLVNNAPGFTGTKVIGRCTFTVIRGIITNVTGC